MDVKDAKLEIWKLEQAIGKAIQTLEKETGLFVEDVFLIRENSTANSGKLIDVDIKVYVPAGGGFSIIKRVL